MKIATTISLLLALPLSQGCSDGRDPDSEISEDEPTIASPGIVLLGASLEHGDLAYRIEGRSVQLTHGEHRSPDGVLTLLQTATGDMNGDGRADLSAVLRLQSSGSGVFYYVNVLLDSGQGNWRHAGEEFLGDRIRFDQLAVYGEGSVSSLTGVPIHPADYGQVVASFYIHSPTQPFGDEPELFITRHWAIQDGALIQLENY